MGAKWGPAIVQNDFTVLLEVGHPQCDEARRHISKFAELVSAPEHVHTYRITPLSLWSALAGSVSTQWILDVLERYARYPVPSCLKEEVLKTCSRYGMVRLSRVGGRMLLEFKSPQVMEQVLGSPALEGIPWERRDPSSCWVDEADRGRIKRACVGIGFPVEDLAGYSPGNHLQVELLPVTRSGRQFCLREYQVEAIESFWQEGSVYGGNGVIVLPCGAGKTVVGLGVMCKARTHTLIIATSVTAARQWLSEIADKTNLDSSLMGEYTSRCKQIRPVTVTTYNMLTHREREKYSHLELFQSGKWGLVIYDEVHLLPAPVFRITSEIQAIRRLGLTATLIREDGREEDVFSLIGPKRYELWWRSLEQGGWIAEAECHEIKVDMDPELRARYVVAGDRARFRLAAENPKKTEVLERIMSRHAGERVLIIGQYTDQLRRIAEKLGAPLITGKTPADQRGRLYSCLRNGELSCLVVSKVANFSVDLPEARVAIQVSGTFGSRQEEAQRLGRVLRPKPDGGPAYFYTLVTRDSSEEEYARKRQRFLVEQGYQYRIHDSPETL
ncbi:MAG: DNA repair helicase XPB [Bacillota bacterium]